METSEVFDTVLKKCTEIEQQVIDSVLERFVYEQLRDEPQKLN